MGTTTAALVEELKDRFEAAGLPDPQFDGRLLVASLLDIGLTELTLHPETVLDEDDVLRVRSAAERRCNREPVHRILGRRAFHTLDLVLTPDTLEPRPDTETLVEAALPLAQAQVQRSGSCRIVDLGTGSGAIGLALLAAVPEAVGLGTDISIAALATARRNAHDNGLAARFSTSGGNWFEAVQGRFDLIVSNPPYIRSADIATLQPEVRDFDPPRALDGGRDGLVAYRAIAAGAECHLAAGGHICVETGADQHLAVIEVFQGHGFAMIERVRDLAGHDRVVVFGRRGRGSSVSVQRS
jgi:release factor glutamine methyltransferase